MSYILAYLALGVLTAILYIPTATKTLTEMQEEILQVSRVWLMATIMYTLLIIVWPIGALLAVLDLFTHE